jgi:protein gp37
MENSKIEWTDHTFNPWWGCVKVSPGCKYCYAEALDNRWKGGNWGPNSPRRMMGEKYWAQPLKWNDEAAKLGIKKKVFCASMADIFEDNVAIYESRTRLFKLIENTPHLTWQLLTKRPENIIRFLPVKWSATTLPDNVWIGTTCENQQEANVRIPHLLKVQSRIKFISCEPLLGPIMFKDVPGFNRIGLDLSEWWVIVGGESGASARPVHPDWIRSIIQQCETAHVPVFFKQWGEYREAIFPAEGVGMSHKLWVKPDGTHTTAVYEPRNLYGGALMLRIGKGKSGAIINGKQYKEFPL